MFKEFVNNCHRRLQRPWSALGQDCFVVGMALGVVLGCAL
jgi:hypothetical protein